MVDGDIPKEIADYLSQQEKSDKRVTCYNSPGSPKGLARGLNRLINTAIESGGYEYFARMDADDVCKIDRFEKQIAFLECHEDISVLGTACEEIDKDGNVIYFKRLPEKNEDLVNRIIKRSPFIHPSVIFRGTVFDSGIRYSEKTHLSEDTELWFTLLKHGFKFANLQDSLIEYRVTSDLYKRRSTFKKGYSEFRAKLRAMKILKMQTPKNYLYALFGLALRTSPGFLVKLAYRYLR